MLIHRKNKTPECAITFGLKYEKERGIFRDEIKMPKHFIIPVRPNTFKVHIVPPNTPITRESPFLSL